jgi:Fe-S-cluster containining protein
MENFENKALEWVSDALNWTDEAIKKLTYLESLPEPLDCKPGCHYCCYNLPMVTPPEALLIGHHVELTFTDQQIKKLNVKIKTILKKTTDKPSDEIFMMRHELPCVFLEESMCLIYAIRPVVCRTCSSTSAAHCKMIFETRNHRARLRTYPQLYGILQTMHSRLTAFCRENECQSDTLHLSKAINDYFKHPDAIDEWSRGGIIFHTPI